MTSNTYKRHKHRRDRQRRHKGQQMAGFTLLEVLIAIALMAMGLMVLLDGQAGSMLMSRYSRDLTVATQLARARMSFLMQEIDDKKITFGISKSSCKDGDFSDDGSSFKEYKWKYCIKKVEIAEPTNLPGFGAPAGDGSDPNAQKSQNASSLMTALGVPAGDASASSIASSLGPFMGMIQGQMKMVFKQLQESLRELQVIVSWNRGGKDYKIAVTTHLFHFNQATGMPDGWPEPKPGETTE